MAMAHNPNRTRVKVATIPLNQAGPKDSAFLWMDFTAPMPDLGAPSLHQKEGKAEQKGASFE
ncbi:hypothetical protein GCM10027164_35310 [Algoriphagus taiwanensis]